MLKKVLEVYKSSELPVNIESIIKDYNITLIKADLWQVDWLFYKNTIWVNSILSKEKQRFTIAHEFCHYLLKETWFSKWIYHSKDLKEKRADEFATKLLLPKKAILEAYKEFWNIPTISEMFQVPVKVVEMRLNNLLNN